MGTGKQFTYAQCASLDHLWAGAFDAKGNICIRSVINNKEWGRSAAGLQGHEDAVVGQHFKGLEKQERKGLGMQVDPTWGGHQGKEPPASMNIAKRVYDAMDKSRSARV